MLDLRTLKLFVAVAEADSLSRAADLNHLSQSALSRQIQSLEETCDMRLFDRSGGRLQLSAEGEALLPRVQALLAHAQELSDYIGISANGHGGALHIGATPQTIESVLPDGLVSFRRNRPGVEIRLREGTNEELLEWVRLGKLHVAIAWLPPHADLDGEPLFRSKVMAVFPRRHALALKDTLDVRDLRGAELLLPMKGFTTRQLFDAACSKAAVDARILFESSSARTLCALAEAGHGIAIVSSAHVAGNTACLSRPVSNRGRALDQVIAAVWSPSLRKSALVAAFVAHLKACVPMEAG